MSQQKNFRKGWTMEHLAAYILSKISFISAPLKIGDDIGIDFFCTLFEEEGNNLIPKNSFSIQIKSNKNSLDIKNKMGNLEKLKIPFFVGVASNDELEIYSGEGLCHFFALYGNSPKKIEAKLEEDTNIYKNHPNFIIEEESKIKILFPKILKIKSNEEYRDIKEKRCIFEDNIQKIQRNLSSMNNNSFLFETTNGNAIIYTGPTSVKYFHVNLKNSLIEAFVNIDKIILTPETKKIKEDYEKLRNFLKSLGWIN